MDTWPCLTVESSSLFFDSFLFGLFFFFFFGGLANFFFAELPHCVNHSVRTNFVWTLWGFFLNLFWGPR